MSFWFSGESDEDNDMKYLGDIEYDFSKTPYYYIYRINHTPHFPKCCPSCGDVDLINDVVHVKTGLQKNKTKSRHSLLCFNCETLTIITREKIHFIMIEPILGNKLVVKSFQLTQVSNEQFPKTDFIKPTIRFDSFTFDGIELVKAALFKYKKHGKYGEYGTKSFRINTSNEATDAYNESCNDLPANFCKKWN